MSLKLGLDVITTSAVSYNWTIVMCELPIVHKQPQEFIP